MNYSILVRNLSKDLRGGKMLKNISFNVRHGDITGIIGRDEEFKLHLIRAINGEVKRTTGNIYVGGQKVEKKYNCPISIQTVAKDATLIPFLSIERNIRLYCLLRRRQQERIDEVLRICELDKCTKVGLGPMRMLRRKLSMAESLLTDPDLVIFYEPDRNLNSHELKELKKVLLNIKNKEKTVIVTSSEYSNLSGICNSLCELDDGVLDVIYG